MYISRALSVYTSKLYVRMPFLHTGCGNLPGIVRFYPLIVNVNSHDTIKRTKKTENLIALTMNGYNLTYI